MLHYFGESFETETGDGGNMDDNIRNPKTKTEAKDEVTLLLKTIKDTNELYKSKEIVNTLIGKSNALIKSHKTDAHELFGKGKDKDASFWMALLRQVLVAGYLKKDIESYGVVKLTKRGKDYLNNPQSFMMSEDHVYDSNAEGDIIVAAKSKSTGPDEKLMKMLKDLRKSVAKRKELPPFVIFQDPSLEDMTVKYPITIEELSNIHGVGEGKAKKYGAQFVKLISEYVEENDIFRPDDFVVKTTGSNSSLKLYIIQNIDRKLPLETIAGSKGMTTQEFIGELEAIVYSGTKLDISYIVNDLLDEDQQEEIHDYFLEDAETDKIEDALEEFDGDYDEEELRLYRIKFISEVAN